TRAACASKRRLSPVAHRPWLQFRRDRLDLERVRRQREHAPGAGEATPAHGICARTTISAEDGGTPMNAGQLTPSPAFVRVAALLPLLDDPELTGSTAQFARAHLAGCAYCQAQRQQYLGIDHALRTRFGLSSVPTRPTEEIMQRLSDHDRPATASPSPA